MDDGDFNGRYILDAQGNPMPCVDLMEWAMWFETARAQRCVARDTVEGYLVSTVFLGLDHNWGSSPTNDPLHYKPVLWETMAFDYISGPTFLRRYNSREAALAGHAEAVELVRETLARQESQLAALMTEISETVGLDLSLVPEPTQKLGVAEDERQSPESHPNPAQVDARWSGDVEASEHQADERKDHQNER